ncbi:MAG: hypothetical protein H0A75_04220 [Candidatus Methanofishera endochildressiae]|uniref:Uncharacterized protein n=1 Tax=Candidatus Methanofishera endochildressiae TaxID=2738884 RepID=A0A7Z0MNP6_9GAMM|nr:hypothetical protein [Candidatus Methanofishera endochildressiae]
MAQLPYLLLPRELTSNQKVSGSKIESTDYRVIITLEDYQPERYPEISSQNATTGLLFPSGD